MNNLDNVDTDARKRERTDCEISASDVARETIFPSHTHTAGPDADENACLNSHLRLDRQPSPSEPADKKCRGDSAAECGTDADVEHKTDGDGTRPTNPNYRMIDPSDDSADAGKS